jgi:hypothetical protein
LATGAARAVTVRSSASLATIMTVLYFRTLRLQDRVAVKAHASPNHHAVSVFKTNRPPTKVDNLVRRDRDQRPNRLSAIGRPPGAVRGHAPGPCFLGAFPQMDVAIDDLQVRYAPEAKQ